MEVWRGNGLGGSEKYEGLSFIGIQESYYRMGVVDDGYVWKTGGVVEE